MDMYAKLTGGVGSCTLTAAKGDDKGPRRFKMRAYNGGAMRVEQFFLPIVIDLKGLKVTAKSRPILANHDPKTPVGHSEFADSKGNGVTIGKSSIDIEGVFSVDNEWSRQIIEASDNRFPWQSSVGLSLMRIVRVPEGEALEANGRKFKGPVLIARQSFLKENSFLALGADDTTSTKVAATATQDNEKESYMDPKFEAWLKAKGHDSVTCGQDVIDALEPIYKTEVEASAKPAPKKITEPKAGEKEVNVNVDVNAAAIESYKKDMMAATLEANQINTICAGHPEVHKQAIEAGWSSDRCETEVKLATLLAKSEDGKGENFNIHMGKNHEVVADELEAAICMAGRLSSERLEKSFDEKVLTAANKKYGEGMGVQELYTIAARANGYTGDATFSRDMQTIHNYAYGYEGRSLQASSSFSTMSLPGILSNVANKFFVDGFNDVEDVWRLISAIRSVKDFKQITSYSLTGANQYKKIAPGGEIEHGALGEVAYTNQVETYAIMLGLTRNDLIDDDLGAFTRAAFKIGRGGALALNEVFWTEFMDNASFFSSGNDNETTGAFGVDGVTALVQSFLLQKDPDDKPMAHKPSIMLTPPALDVANKQMHKDTQIVSGTDGKVLSGNPHQGLYTPVTSVYLQDASITGNSALMYYLLGNPNSIPVIETAFLNGKQTPTVESQDAAFNRLGMQMRGVYDFGVNKQEYRGGARSTGA